MSNSLLVKKFGMVPSLSHVLNIDEKIDKLPQIKTYFTNYRNPIGIEVEVENCQGVSGMVFWQCEKDSSLKVSGKEFISIPLSGKQVDYALAELEDLFSRTLGKLLWSHRTSIHIHQNMSSLREQHLTGYVMLYGLFEDLFFSMVDKVREGNPYCYRATELDPVEFCNLTENNKYCALNLYPIKPQCTVEYRHMHGTQDFKLIRRWIQLIMKMHRFVEDYDSREIVGKLLTHIRQQTFTSLAKEVFGASIILFTEEQIYSSGKRNAVWSTLISEQEFV